MASSDQVKETARLEMDPKESAPEGAEESVEEMMGNLKLTAAEADKLIIDEEEEIEKPNGLLQGRS
jgi:hypothetical protein